MRITTKSYKTEENRLFAQFVVQLRFDGPAENPHSKIRHTLTELARAIRKPVRWVRAALKWHQEATKGRRRTANRR